MVGWHHWLNGLEFEQALGVGDGQGSLGCCSPWGHKESDTTEQLSWYWSSFSPVWLFVTVWMGVCQAPCLWDSPGKNIEGLLCPPQILSHITLNLNCSSIFFSLDIFQIGLLRLCLYSFKSYQLVHSKKSTERKREREREREKKEGTWYHKTSV